MKVIVTGATGLVGSALVERLTAAGHTALSLGRGKSNDLRWDPAAGQLDPAAVAGADAVVHLAGENIAGARWNAEVKRRIRDSRVQGTELLSRTLAALDPKPKVLVSASAIGYYGDRGDEKLDEQARPGSGFLPDVCREWEEATEPARLAGLRVVNLRIGIVLSKDGGALAKMLLPFRLGGGGRVGSGRQYWSWISLDDLIGAIVYAVETPSLSGAVNAVAPQPATNLEFTKTLGRVLRRPTIMPLPGFAARIMLGEMADSLLLASARVLPARLQNSGYPFVHRELESALRSVLK